MIATGFFIPEEAYFCLKHFDWERITLLALNVVVLVYVLRVLWAQKHPKAP